MPKPIDDSKMWDAFVEERKTVVEQHETKILDAYKNGQVTKEQLIEEGLWDQLKARGAGAVGSAKGLGQRVGGMAKGAMAGVKGDTAGVQAAQQQQQSASSMGINAKAVSIINSYSNKIMKLVDGLKADLKSLGLDSSIQKTNPEIYNAIDVLKQETSRLYGSVSKTGGSAGTGGRTYRNAQQIPGFQSGTP